MSLLPRVSGQDVTRMPVNVPNYLPDDENVILSVRCPVLSLSPSELNLPGLGPRLKPRPGPSSPGH